MSEVALVARYEHMAKRRHEGKARELLLKTASLVKPIMKKHKWKVGTLAEFVPSNPSLLGMNMNGGQKILLRLRPHAAQETFYDQEQLVLVMLHELTHNVHGPHDASFYKLLGELEEEWYELKRTGYSGEGFLGNGTRVGGGLGVPQHIGRIKGLEAAEKRRQKGVIMGTGGRLGGEGRPPAGKKSMREVLADAAERRMKDDKSCEHGNSKEIEEEVAKAAKESQGENASEIIEIDDSDDELPIASSSKYPTRPVVANFATTPSTKSVERSPPAAFPKEISKKARIIPDKTKDLSKDAPPISPIFSPYNPDGTWNCPTCTLINRADISNCSICDDVRPRQPPRPPSSLIPKSAPSTKPEQASSDGSWTCPSCTFNNVAHRTSCEMCDDPQPRDASKGWWCEECYHFGNEHAYWMCRNCGAIKKKG